MVAGALALPFDINTASASEANVAPTINEEFVLREEFASH
jgi:hypothetical protein